MNKYDAHGYVATLVYDECKDCHPNEVKKLFPHYRQDAKSINFLMDYGGTEYALSKSTGKTKEECRKLIDKYYEGFSDLAEYNTRQKRYVHKHRYVKTITGHKRHLPDANCGNQKKEGYCERMSLNGPIQGLAAEVTSAAQVLVNNDKVLNALDCKMLLQVHDELVFDFPKKYAEICTERIVRHMERNLGIKFTIPLTVSHDRADNYAAAK